MSLNGANRTNHLARIVPNLTTLIQVRELPNTAHLTIQLSMAAPC